MVNADGIKQYSPMRFNRYWTILFVQAVLFYYFYFKFQTSYFKLYMCFYFQMSADAQTLENRFKKPIQAYATLTTQTIINGFEHPKVAIITNENIFNAEWGLLPNWAKDKALQKSTLNARVETLAEKPSFKNCINNRCLIPASGFFEWQWMDEKGKQKEKYFIQVHEQSLFAFAGLFSDWLDKSTGEMIRTCTIITTQANELMSQIHNTKQRMPIILKPQDESDWLTGKAHQQFAYPYQSQLIAYKM